MKILIENESFECASGATVYDALKEAGKISKEVLADGEKQRAKLQSSLSR